MKIKPIFNSETLAGRVVIEPLLEEETRNDIVITLHPQEQNRGRVIATVDEDGPVKVGDIVLYKAFAGTITGAIDGKNYIIMEETDLLAIDERPNTNTK
jgi:co-chaperonin GroES (HSP10)